MCERLSHDTGSEDWSGLLVFRDRNGIRHEWPRDFVHSVLGQAKCRRWATTPKQTVTMRRIVTELRSRVAAHLAGEGDRNV